MRHSKSIKYFNTEDELNQYCELIQFKKCPFCVETGFLIRHGFLRGYSANSEETVIRGRRFFCSNRHRKTGCGRTFSVLLSDMLKGFVVTASILWHFLQHIESGDNTKVAWQKVATEFSVESGYRILRLFEQAQSRLRTMLCKEKPPPEVDTDSQVLQLVAHFQTVFPLSSCPFQNFQNHFQMGLLR
jgi:hypothetical protein